MILMVELRSAKELRTKGTPGGRRISHDLRVELYHFVKDLHKRGVGYRRIQRIVEEKYGIWLSRSNISYWVRGLHSPLNEPYNKPDFSKPEMAWVAGMCVGDGSIKVNKKGRFLALKVKDRELVEEAARKLAVVMGREKPYAVGKLSDGRYYVHVQSRELVDHLLKRENVLMHLRRNPKEFIRAFFDCEGNISGHIIKNGRFDFNLSAVNTDLEMLEEIQEELEDMDIFSYLYLHYPRGRVIITRKGITIASKECYVLCVAETRSIMIFEEKIGFSIIRKREKLKDIVHILERFGRGPRAAVEWIRRYEYVTRKGRERWYKRDKSLSLEDAMTEYERHLAFLRRRGTAKAG